MVGLERRGWKGEGGSGVCPGPDPQGGSADHEDPSMTWLSLLFAARDVDSTSSAGAAAA